MERGVHAMSGTPGRVYEMIKRGSLQTKYVKILIIDRVMEVRCWAKVSKTTFTRLTDTMFMFALFCYFSSRDHGDDKQVYDGSWEILVKRDGLTLEVSVSYD